MTPVIYLQAQQVLLIHDRVIKQTGGFPGIRSIDLLESAVARPAAPMGEQDLFPTILEKAAVLLQSLAKNHPFFDGNKRTALVSCGIFLSLNGWQLINAHQEEEALVLKVAEQDLGWEHIASWLQSHTKKLV